MQFTEKALLEVLLHEESFYSERFMLISYLRQFTETAALQKSVFRDFPGGSVTDSTLPMQEAQVRSLVGDLDPTCHNGGFKCCN